MPFDVSVVIPTYLAGPRLIDTIDSVINQTDVTIQIIIVEDGSSLPSEVLLRKQYPDFFDAKLPDQRVSLEYFHQENQGAYLARLYGVEKCNGDYIKFLDQDDEILQGSFIKEVTAFETSYDVVLSNWVIAHSAKTDLENKEVIQAPNLINPIDDFLTHGGVFTSAALYRAELLKQALKPVSTFKPIKADDWLIFAQICLAGAQYKTIDNIAYIWNQSDEQLSKKTRDSLVNEHYQILNWIELELKNTQRLTPRRKELLANYYAKQLLEAYSKNQEIFEKLSEKIDTLNPSYRQQHGNRIYRTFCNLLGLKRGVKYYASLKSLIVRNT